MPDDKFTLPTIRKERNISQVMATSLLPDHEDRAHNQSPRISPDTTRTTMGQHKTNPRAKTTHRRQFKSRGDAANGLEEEEEEDKDAQW